MQIIQITGNISKSAESKTSESGYQYIQMTVAAHETVNGEEQTSFYYVTSARYKNAQPYTKGRKVAVAGTFRYKSLLNKKGEPITYLYIYANNIELLDKKPAQKQADTAAAEQTNDDETIRNFDDA